MQILIQSKKEDLSQHIKKIRNNSQKQNNKILKKYSEKYLQYIEEKNNKNKSASKNIYLIYKNTSENIEENIIQDLNEKQIKIKECLGRCGNLVVECNKEETKNILFSFFNLKKFLESQGGICIYRKNKKNKKNNYIINKIKTLKNKIIKKNVKILNEGTFNDKDYISPTYINLKNPKYLEIDDYYYSGIIIVNYYREYNELILKTLIETNINMNISIFYEKGDKSQIIKELAYNIGNVGVELKQFTDSRIDTDIAAFTYNDAKYIRKEIQINNEDVYFLYIYLNVFSNDKKELEYNLDKVEGILQSKGLQTRRANFRQEQIFLSCLPILKNSEDLKVIGKRNILTSGLISTYPFISSSIFEEDGIYIGNNMYNNSLILIDRYNTSKYKNANMCIFGTSGAGKSFYTKLLILRNSLLNIEQYIIDPEKEYNILAQKLNGSIIKLGPTSENYINIFDIRKESIEENEHGYLATKIGKLIGFFNLIFGEINEEEKAILEEKIIKTYNDKNINFNDRTLYKKRKFKTTQDMPILEDFYKNLDDDKTKKFKIKLLPFIKGSLKFFNNYTNVELNKKLIVADVYELGEDSMKYGMYLFTELFWDKIKIDRNVKKAIYLDEIWRLIGVTSNREVAKFIYKIFKTIRKYGGSSVAITQDISDLFSLDNGTYGKSILNNSSIKTFFSLEEENIKLLAQYSNLSEKEKMEIKALRRGECLTFVGDEHILISIEAGDFEKEIIEKK